jgi:hypothetical protein
MFVGVFCALVPLVSGHGQMTYPPTRFHTTLAGAAESGQKGGWHWFSQGCQPGCSVCTDKFSGDTCSEPGGTMAPTINDEHLRTWKDAYGYDFTKRNPWRAPGYSPVFSPCGIAGGGNISHPGNGAIAVNGATQGADGRDLPEGPKTQWALGSVQEVAWSIVANHGGGYAYRLCPKSSELTEACFQSGHLEFASAQTWIQYGDNTTNRTAIPATRVSEGTFPAGSVWTKNPIPACGQYNGGVGDGSCEFPAQFDPPLPYLYGYGSATCFTGSAGHGGHCTAEQRQYFEDHFRFNIIDQVIVPKDLSVGEYVLSFRWDCEQTPQVWTQCADITVIGARNLVV